MGIFLILFLLFYQARWISSNENLKPKFTRYPSDSYALPRRQLTLKCTAIGVPFPFITWYKDGHLVQSQHDKPGTSNLIISQGELLFLSFTREDEGHYYCNATNAHGWTVSPPAMVREATFDASNARDPQGKTVFVGDSVSLECSLPIGSPFPVSSWIRDNNVLENNDRVTIKANVVQFRPVTLQDSGSYECYAYNEVGSWRSKPAHLIVQKKNRVHHTPGNKIAITGEDVELECLINGDSNSTIIWKRDSGSVPRTSSINQKSLRIENVKLSDAGNYICTMTGPFGITEGVSHLSVVSPPSFLITPNDKEVNVGDNVYFDCFISGNPPPTIRWTHRQHVMWVPEFHEKPRDYGKFMLFSNGTLFIRSVAISDEGLYECKASHLARIERSSAYLYVRAVDVPPIPIIEVGPQNQTVPIGTILILPCHASALQYPLGDITVQRGTSKFRPEVHIEWLINGNRVSNMHDPRIIAFPSGSIQLNAIRLEDSGTYVCRASTEDLSQPNYAVRSTSWLAQIDVKSSVTDFAQTFNFFYNNIPFAPTLPPPDEISVIDIGDTWIDLEIIDATNGTIVPQANSHHGFRIEVLEYDSLFGFVPIIPFTSNKKNIITGLRPSTTYAVLARRINGELVGQPRLLSHLVHTTRTYADHYTLKDHAHSLQFGQLHLKPISPSELSVEWSLCGTPDFVPAPSNFKLTYQMVPLSACLLLDGEENISLKEETTSAVPTCPNSKLFGSHSEILLPHCSISELTKQSMLDHQPVYQSPKHLTISLEPIIPNSTVFRTVIGSLSSFVCYTVQVDVLYSETNNPIVLRTSSAVSALTYDNLPQAPPKVISAYWLQNQSVLAVEWKPPSENERGGVLTGYKLRVLASPPQLIREIRVGAESRSFKFSNLDLFVNYTIYIAALNCRGEGVRSSPVHVYTNLLTTSSPRRYVVYGDGRMVPSDQKQSANLSPASDEDMKSRSSSSVDSLTREPWFIIGVVAFVVLWAVIVIGLILCGRHRSRRHARSRDLSNLDKNGRIISPDSFTTSPWAAFSAAETRPLVYEANLDTAYLTGEKPLTHSNGYHAVLSQGEQATSNFGGMPIAFTPGYNNQYPLAQPNAIYASAANLPVTLAGNMHPLQSPVPLTPNGHLPNRYEPRTCNKVNNDALEDEDTVTPYASVPVMQQMIRYNSSSGGPSRNHSDIHRQLSLAKIIPPPPDYPPPSLPSGSPPLASSDHRGSGLAHAPGSASGEDSAYYAQSELQQTPNSLQSNRGHLKAVMQWSGSLPASDESAAFLTHDLSHHSGSQSFAKDSNPLVTPNPLTAGFAS